MIRQFGWALGLTVVALALALGFGGPETAFIVLILGVLEVSLSFDNAVVNAKVLNRMHPVWQKLFLTVGILIAVFGMRLVLPILIVSITASLSIPDVIDLALNDATAYGERLAESEAAIYAFGGTFLLMIFLDFVLDTERDIFWLTPIEKALHRIGKLDQLSVVLAIIGVYVMSRLADEEEVTTVLVSGLAGLFVYLLVNGLDGLFEESMEHREERGDLDNAPTTGKMTMQVFKAGVFAFLYLEVLDASFSFDGVIGAFAISNEVLVIALGLGIGAFWIRSLTIYLVRQGTLSEYLYLEHGAHWAIGVLALIMLASVKYHIPEVVTGLTGVAFIAAALVSSLAERRRRPAQDDVDSAEVLGVRPAVALSLPAPPPVPAILPLLPSHHAQPGRSNGTIVQVRLRRRSDGAQPGSTVQPPAVPNQLARCSSSGPSGVSITAVRSASGGSAAHGSCSWPRRRCPRCRLTGARTTPRGRSCARRSSQTSTSSRSGSASNSACDQDRQTLLGT